MSFLAVAVSAVGAPCFVSGPSPFAQMKGSPGMSAVQLNALTAAKADASTVKLGTNSRWTNASNNVYASGGCDLFAPTGRRT